MTATAQQPIRATALKAGRLSMAHMRLEMMRRSGDAVGGETASMRWGRLVHLAILQPDKLASLPVWRGARRAGGEWTTFSFMIQPGGDYVTPAELADLSAVGKAAAVAMAKLPAVETVEQYIEWTDKEYGRACCQPDALLVGGYMLEVKSTARIERRAFTSQAWTLGYPLQVAWYDHGLREVGIVGPRIMLAIEATAPYATALYEFGPQTTRDFYGEAYAIAARYRACEAAGRFPGPYDADGVVRMEPPKWAVNDAMEQDISTGTMEASEL